MVLRELNLDWKIYHLVEDDINEMFSQYKTQHRIIENASLISREAFSYFQNFAFDMPTQADRQARATTA